MHLPLYQLHARRHLQIVATSLSFFLTMMFDLISILLSKNCHRHKKNLQKDNKQIQLTGWASMSENDWMKSKFGNLNALD